MIMGLEILDGWLSDVETFKDDFGTLAQIKTLNEKGDYVILCPNHLKPDSKVRECMALADDYGVLKHQLNKKGIKKIGIVLRGDADIKLTSKISLFAYELVRKTSSALAQVLTQAYPTNLNIADNEKVRTSNLSNIKNILEGMETTNMILYPFGNRFAPGEQEFVPSEAYDTNEDRLFQISKDGTETWHKGIKKGFIQFSKLNSHPIVPIYITKQNGKRKIAIGKIIKAQPKNKKEYLRIIDEYLEQMRDLKKSL